MTHATFGNLALERVGKDQWALKRKFVYTTFEGQRISVPEGYVTDGASSPFRVLITPFGGHYPQAAVIHDYLYDRLNQGNPHPAAPTRKKADQVLREMMRRGKVKPLVRAGIYLGVRAFGGPTLRKLGVR